VAEETTKIVRMQQRRGQKQDLPKPLRPGEIGFATDSRQIYIGADTTDAVSDIYNKTGNFEKTASAQSTTASIANVQMIKFIVPHKVYDKGSFDGVTDTVSWTPATDAAASSTANEYGRLGKVFTNITLGAEFKNNITGNVFVPTDLTVLQNGTVLSPSNVATISSGNDYFFSQTGNLALSDHTHTLSLRTSPSGADEISTSYYANTAIIEALANTTIGKTGKPGFYSDKQISTYRQLSTDNVRVAGGIGIGYIGMQFKHIQVATDVKYPPSTATFAEPLGTLYLTKTDTAVAGVTATASASSIALAGDIVTGSYSLDIDGLYDSAGIYNHVYVKGGTDWLAAGKVLAVSAYNSTGQTLTATLPNNASSVTRQISAVDETASNKIILTSENVENTEVNDVVLFIDEAAGDPSQLNGDTGTITAIDTITNQLTITTNYADYSASANLELLTFVTHKNGADTEIVVQSPRHGNLVGGNVELGSTGGGLSGSHPVNAVTGNTFVTTTAGAVTANSSALTSRPVVSSATVEATPVVSYDLSGATTSAAVQTVVNGANLWPKISTLPARYLANAPTVNVDANKMYITHSEAVQKLPFKFALHDDEASTVTSLGFIADEYDRTDSTVKAKLEDWISTTMAYPEVNMFSAVYVNKEFNSTEAASPGNGHFPLKWDTKINGAVGEMDFEERTEARDFARILNNLYFESVNTDIRGLMNIKTNIEFLTAEALAAGTAITAYTAPEQLTILTGNSTVSELDIPFSGSNPVNTQFVEYSMQGTTGSGSYRRVGTLMYSGDSTIDDIVFVDNYTDARSGTLTGNVNFEANVSAAGTGAISVSNTLNPATSVTVKYIVRRWAD
jgi:hypothetical protein